MSSNLISKHISVLNRYLHLVMARALKPVGVGMGQYPYIIAVCKQPGVSQDGLTGQLFFNKSSVARAIAQLEGGGFLTRETDPANKRAYRLYPTEKGLEAYGLIMDLLGQHLDGLLEDFSPQERETVTVLLSRMVDNAGKLADANPPVLQPAEAKQTARELE